MPLTLQLRSGCINLVDEIVEVKSTWTPEKVSKRCFVCRLLSVKGLIKYSDIIQCLNIGDLFRVKDQLFSSFRIVDP